MNAYRAFPALETYYVEAVVRGPLGPIVMSARMPAINESHAADQLREDLELDGFEILGEVQVRKT